MDTKNMAHYTDYQLIENILQKIVPNLNPKCCTIILIGFTFSINVNICNLVIIVLCRQRFDYQVKWVSVVQLYI